MPHNIQEQCLHAETWAMLKLMRIFMNMAINMIATCPCFKATDMSFEVSQSLLLVLGTAHDVDQVAHASCAELKG